jgi:hypothetical protein
MLLLAWGLDSCSLFVSGDPPTDSASIFEQVWSGLDQGYALFAVKQIDWAAIHQKYAARITSQMESHQLFAELSAMLSEVNDRHVTLSSPFASFCSGVPDGRLPIEAFSLNLVRDGYLRDGGSAGGGRFNYGILPGGAGYLHIRSFTGGTSTVKQTEDWCADIDLVLEKLSPCPSLVLDVRNNLGGLPANAEFIAARFADQERLYARIATRNGPNHENFTEAVDHKVAPAGPAQFRKPIILLTNRNTMSAAELFCLAVLSRPQTRQVGGPTAGALSLSLDRPLSNGWRYTVSVERVLDASGRCPERTGLQPEEAWLLDNNPGRLATGQDEQLEAAIAASGL